MLDSKGDNKNPNQEQYDSADAEIQDWMNAPMGRPQEHDLIVTMQRHLRLATILHILFFILGFIGGLWW